MGKLGREIRAMKQTGISDFSVVLSRNRMRSLPRWIIKTGVNPKTVIGKRTCAQNGLRMIYRE